MGVYSQVGGIQVGVNRELGKDRWMRIDIVRSLFFVACGLGILAAQSGVTAQKESINPCHIQRA